MTVSLQSRIEGAVLGAAIGDAMGHPTEFINSFEGIFNKYGPQGVTGFELFWTREGKRFAPYTDDTQMAEVVLRTLVEARKMMFDLDATMNLMAGGFVTWSRNPQGGHRAPGRACLEGANTPGDSDSIATLAGALAGARCGVGSIPAEWVRDVERSEELLGLARSIVEVLGREGRLR